MIKKIFICLCLLLCLCSCSQSSVETDTTNDDEIVQTQDNSEEDTQTSEEETTEDNEEESIDSSSKTSDTTDTTASNESSTNQSLSDNTRSNKTQSSSSSNSSSSQSSSSNNTNNNQSSTNETTQETKIYCTYTIDCSSILSHSDALQSNYQVPSNGVIYNQKVEIQEGDTVMSILKRTGISTDISLGYVKGIDGLYEFDCGSESGWTYSVNGAKPNVGASKYSVSDGDVIKWIYVVTRSEW